MYHAQRTRKENVYARAQEISAQEISEPCTKHEWDKMDAEWTIFRFAYHRAHHAQRTKTDPPPNGLSKTDPPSKYGHPRDYPNSPALDA